MGAAKELVCEIENLVVLSLYLHTFAKGVLSYLCPLRETPYKVQSV